MKRHLATVTAAVTLACGMAAAPAAAYTFTVTSTGNWGGTAGCHLGSSCTLRAAINAADETKEHDLIRFRIGSGPVTIRVPLNLDNSNGFGALPRIDRPVTIDGTTQPGYQGAPLIEIRGGVDQYGNRPSWGLNLAAGDSVIKGLVLNAFDSHVDITGDRNKLERCYIGTNREGNADGSGAVGAIAAESGTGVAIEGDANRVGGSAAARNVIAGVSTAVLLHGGAASNSVADNFIGTDATGSQTIGNFRGVELDTHTFPGEPGRGPEMNRIARNVISGNRAGVVLQADSYQDSFGHPSANHVVGNLIGTDHTGRRPLGNGLGVRISGHGTAVWGGMDNYIGGVRPADRNVISGNGSGVLVENKANGNVIRGNYIGTDVTGARYLPNRGHGVRLEDAPENTVGGLEAGSGNVISGNHGSGVFIRGAGAHGNVLRGNSIGTTALGDHHLRNVRHGVEIQHAPRNIVGGTAVAPDVARNVISGNTGIGVFIAGATATGNRLEGNHIGTDAAGSARIGNLRSGVQIQDASETVIGGSTWSTRNVISGNGEAGIAMLDSLKNRVQSNYIGLAVDGSTPLGNVQSGLHIQDSRETRLVRNVISANGHRDDGFAGFHAGVLITGAGSRGNILEGNVIGTDATATQARGNPEGVVVQSPGNYIGGAAAGLGNLISGNLGSGVLLDGPDASANNLLGNYIGTNGAGSAALPNGRGITVEGGSSNRIGGGFAGAGNVISGNTLAGIQLLNSATAGTTVAGNRIGLQASSDGALGNADGIFIDGARDTEVADGNAIAHNRGAGVRVLSGTGHDITRNSIHSNRGLGIDLGPAGVTENDSKDVDTGANQLQNFPVLSSVTPATNEASVTGALWSKPDTSYLIEFYASRACDGSGNGEGERYLGSVKATSGAFGRARFTDVAVLPVRAGEYVTAVAKHIGGEAPERSTSEFSDCHRVG